MYARYGEDSPLDKGYVKTNDQVFVTLKLKNVVEAQFPISLIHRQHCYWEDPHQ